MEVQEIILRTLLLTCAVYIVAIETKYVLELDDVTAAVSDKFVYTIGDQKFLQTYRIHRIVDRKTKSLPDWLSFNNSTNILYGTPSSDDIGTYSIRMKATCIDPPNMACQEKISRSFQIRIVEPIKSAESRGRDKYRLHAWSDKHHGKYSLNLTSLTVTSASVMDPSNIYMHGSNNLIDSPSLHSSFSYSYTIPVASRSFINSFVISPCGNSVPSFYASLLLHVPREESINILNSKIVSFATFLSKPLPLIALTNSSNIMLSVNMDNKHIITAGPGNIVGSLKESLELTWHVSCREFLHVAEFGKVLQHNIDVGRITKELGTDVIAWFLYSDQPVSHRHKRQANARFRQTKTPSFSIVPSTSILEVSTFITTLEPDLTSIELDISLSSRSLVMISTSSEFETSLPLFSSSIFKVSSLFDSDSELIQITSSTTMISASLLDSSMPFIDSSTFQDLSSDEFLTTSFPKFLSSISSSESDEISSFQFDIPSFVDSLTIIQSSSIQISSQETNISSLLSSTPSSEIEFRATVVTSSKPSLDKPDISTSMLTVSQDSSPTSIESVLSISPSPSVIRSSSFLSSDFDEGFLSSFSSVDAPYTTLQSSTLFIPSTVFTTSSISKGISTIPETFQSVTIIQTSSISSSISSRRLFTTDNILPSFTVESSTTAVSSLTILGSSLFQSSLLSESFQSIGESKISSTDTVSKFDMSSIFPPLSSSFQIISVTKTGADISGLSVSQISAIEDMPSDISSTFDHSRVETSSLLVSSSLSNFIESSTDIISITSSNISMNESGISVSVKSDRTFLFTSFPSSEISSTKDLSQLHTSFSQSVSETSMETQMSISLSQVLSTFESFAPSFTSTQFSMQTPESTPPLSSFVDTSSVVDFVPESTRSLQTSVMNSDMSPDTFTVVDSSIAADMITSSLVDIPSSTSEPVKTKILTSTAMRIPDSTLLYDTDYTSMTLTLTVPETTSKVLMTSSLGIPHVPTDDPPFRQNSIDHLTIVFDKFFTYRIPANTFNDTEDGNTRNLSLSISLLYGKPIPLGAWLKFNSTSQTLYGIPLQQDIKNEDRFVERIVLIAQDSQKQTTRDVISLSYSIEVLAITHSISLELDLDFDNFHLERQNLVDVAESIAELYGNPNLKYLTFFDVRKGSVVVRWGNNSLFGSICYKDIIHDVFSRIANENGTFTAEFEDLMSQYNPVSATLDLTGPCLLPQLTPLPPFDSPVGASDNDRMWIEILLPALVVILILVIIALVLLICCRHKKPSKEPQSDKPTFLEDRRPIIFPEELEMVDPSLKPKQPLILPRDYLTETPPAVPPHGSQDPPSYRVPDIDDAIFRPTSSQTPPPPSYGNQATSEPPPYRLPPPYYNPHRANIKT